MNLVDYIEPSAILRFFQYDHLPESLQKISRPFGELAKYIDQSTAENESEKQMALRKLLEAKDCAVRACLEPNPSH